MAQLRQLLLILCLLFSFIPAFGDDVRLILQNAEYQRTKANSCQETFQSCNNSQVAKSRRDHWKIQADTCIKNYRALGCEKIAQEEPALRNKMKNCTPQGQCREQTFPDADMLKGCFWNAPQEIGFDMMEAVFAGSEALIKKVPECYAPKQWSEKLISIWQCQAPIYWVYSLYQNMPSTEKIFKAGRDWVEKKGVKFQCYSPEAQAQMACYGVLAVFAPGQIVKVAKALPEIIELTKLGLSANRIGKARLAALPDRASVGGAPRIQQLPDRASVRPLLREKPPASAQGAGLTVPRRSGGADGVGRTAPVNKVASKTAVPTTLSAREIFSEKHVSKTFATEAQNEKWVNLANLTDPPPGARFFDVENSAMKRLNDSTLDKNFVTALTNQHKELIIGKMEALAAKYPDVDFVRYSDFKSVRYAVVPKPPATKLPYNLEMEVGNAFKQANSEFVTLMKDQNLIPKGEDPAWWFRGGWGDTADEATFASRYSRVAPDTNYVRKFTDADLVQSQETTLKYAEAYRGSIQSSFKSTSLLEASSVDGKMIPKAEVFDAMRKTETPEQLASFLKKTTGETISLEQAKILRTYGEMTDEFSPGIHIARREQAILDKPTGGITFDLVGAGSENSQATANALVKAKDVESAVKEARFGERSVTENLNRRKAEIKNTVAPILAKYKIKARFVASGDDMAVIPDTPIPAAVKKEIAAALAKTDKPSSIRMSSVNSGISNVTDRMVMATQGESVEKATRKYLQGALPKEILDRTLVSVQMEGKALGQGDVRLVLGEGVKLTGEQKNAFNAAFEKAVKDLKANYKPIN